MANIKKLSVSTVYGKIDLKTVLNRDAPLPIMRVYGQAVSQKRGESAYGPWVALLGQFRAVPINADGVLGEPHDAATLHLPDVALTPILVALASGPTTFAIELQVQKASNGKPGGSPYEYAFKHLLAPAESDPLKVLESQMLAAPGGDTDADAKPAAKSGKK